MKTAWKYTALLTLLIIGVMQVLPFVPTHTNCEAACCMESVSCCETETSMGCEMAMASCDIALFMPLISASLIKVESNIELEMAPTPILISEIPRDQNLSDSYSMSAFPEAHPPGYFPLLI